MGVLTAIMAFLAIICMALGIVNVLNVSSEPIFSANMTWQFWLAMAGFFMLCVIALALLGRGRNYGD
jgi:hypothetical protein